MRSLALFAYGHLHPSFCFSSCCTKVRTSLPITTKVKVTSRFIHNHRVELFLDLVEACLNVFADTVALAQQSRPDTSNRLTSFLNQLLKLRVIRQVTSVERCQEVRDVAHQRIVNLFLL